MIARKRLLRFRRGKRTTFQVSWGDVATAFHSTGIPNIEVHFEATSAAKALVRMPRPFNSFLVLASCRAFSKPALTVCEVQAKRRGAPSRYPVGVARNDGGGSVRSRLRTPEGYNLTVATALDAAVA